MLEIGKKIKSLRQQKGWSQGDVSKQMGLSVAAFSKIETDVTDISLSRMEQIVDIFGITLAQLILSENEQPIEYADELKKARDNNEANVAKILALQEYIITLYEELHQQKKIAPA